MVCVQRYIALWDWWSSLLPHFVNPCCGIAHKAMVTPHG